jgi:hypothetical protein
MESWPQKEKPAKEKEPATGAKLVQVKEPAKEKQPWPYNMMRKAGYESDKH